MLCCWSSRSKRVELDEEEKVDAQPNPESRQVDAQLSLHDYIYSPKDFCDSVLQKKLIPEYYLNGIDVSSLHENELRLSQEDMNDPVKRRNGLRASQGEARRAQRASQRNLRASQGGLRTSRSNPRLSLRSSQGDDERASLTASQEDEFDASADDSQNTSLIDENALRASLGDDSGNALRKSQSGDAILHKSQGAEDGMLRKSQDNLAAEAQAQEEAGIAPMTPRRGSARYSSFFSSTSYVNINYYEEFCALFPHFAIVPTEGYRVELGGRVVAQQELFLQEQDAHNLAYQKIFQKNDHNNFVGGAETSNPFIISILACDDVEGGCRTIVRTKHRDHHLIVPYQTPAIKMAKYAFAQIQKIDKALPNSKDKKFVMQQIRGQFIVKDLANFEDKAYKSKHKMGILYSKGGQTTEEEMFCNTEPSHEFLEFLDMIGERVPLRGFPPTQFNGGLDTKADLTGTESYYTTFEGCEIMFHVSTLLPFTPDRPIQIERKKHIGNDVVCIVFMDSPTPFKPNTITSKFIHVVIVVQFLERNSNNQPVYRVSVASKLGVDPHHPILPTPPHFEGGEDFQKFLITKAINAERAATHAPAFKLARTRMNGLATIVEKHMEEVPPKKCFG